MEIEITKETPEPKLTARIQLTMTHAEWRDWNRRVQAVDKTCPLRDIAEPINRFVLTYAKE